MEGERSIVLDILVAEKTVMAQYREDYKLYFKDKDGKFVQLTEYYRDEVNEVIKEMFRKKKLRYVMAFIVSFKQLALMKPYTIRVMCYFVENMRRNNRIHSQSLRLICEKSKVTDKYVSLAIKQLLELDVVRRVKAKNSYDYMVNPAYFTKASLRSSFTLAEWYEQMPCESTLIEEFHNFEKI